MARPRSAALVLVACALFGHAAAQMNIDGGRGDLPGMKQDMFDRVQANKGKPGPQKGKGRPDCPKSDKMSPFPGLAFVSGEVFVKLNSSEEQCQRLITVGGANYSELTNASKTCGPAGEWKKRIAEEMSAVFFQAGLDWVRSENETIEVVTEEGTFEIEVSEAKFNEMVECWTRGCGCEQAKNPAGRAVCMSLLVIAVVAMGWDAIKLGLEKVHGKKPSKHVTCPKGHRMEEVKFAYTHSCDRCGKSGTQYQSRSSNYDLCKACYKLLKKQLKDEIAEWVAKHPEDAKEFEKKSKKGDDDDDDDKKGANSESEAAKSEPESESASASAKKSEDEAKSGDDDGEEEADN